MNIFAWILIGWLVFSSLFIVAGVGKQRTPTTPGVAAAAVFIQAALIALVIAAVMA
jgi:hypothetical protein